MPSDDRKPAAGGLTRAQRRMLFWIPLIGGQAVLFICSRPPEGPRDWGSTLAFGLLAAVCYVALWLGLLKATTPRHRRTPAQAAASAGKSRAALIYGDKEKPPCDEDT